MANSKFNQAAAVRGVMHTMPETKELKAFFGTAASGRSTLDDIRGTNAAARRLDPALKLTNGKVVRGVGGKDTHRALAQAHGLINRDGAFSDAVRTRGFFDKRNKKFIGALKSSKKFGILDALELIDPRKMGKTVFGAGALPALLAQDVLDLVMPGGLFPPEQFGPEI